MTTSVETAAALAEKLAPDNNEPLTKDERALALAALAQFAAAQEEIALLRRRLRLLRESCARMDGATAEALERVGAAGALPSPSAGYDFDAAERARKELIDTVHNARTAQEVAAGALMFARDVLALLGK